MHIGFPLHELDGKNHFSITILLVTMPLFFHKNFSGLITELTYFFH